MKKITLLSVCTLALTGSSFAEVTPDALGTVKLKPTTTKEMPNAFAIPQKENLTGKGDLVETHTALPGTVRDVYRDGTAVLRGLEGQFKGQEIVFRPDGGVVEKVNGHIVNNFKSADEYAKHAAEQAELAKKLATQQKAQEAPKIMDANLAVVEGRNGKWLVMRGRKIEETFDKREDAELFVDNNK